MTSPRDPLFDQRIADWLETDPDHAPVQALDIILAAVPSIPQRRATRPPWRFPTMTTPIRLATAAVIGVLAVGGALFLLRPGTPTVGGPSATPGASSSPTVVATSTPSTTLPSPTPVPTRTAPAGCVNPPPDIAALSAQTDPVACYGNAPLTLDAYPIAAQVDCPVVIEPAWLGCPSIVLRLVGETRKVGAPEVLVAVDPAGGVSMSDFFNKNVRITGHLDDPAAQTCRETGRAPDMGTPEPAAATIERCRRNFVVTQVVPLKP